MTRPRFQFYIFFSIQTMKNILLLFPIIKNLASALNAPNGLDKNSYEKKNGIFIKDVVTGRGPSISRGDEIEVHFAGWYYTPGATEGIKFDDSMGRNKKRGLILEYGALPVIAGWNLGLQTMKEGGIRTIIIPSKLAYGSEKASCEGRRSIPPNSELLLDLELLAVNKDEGRKFRRRLGDFLFPS